MIREATLTDLDAMVRMGTEFHDSTPYAMDSERNPAQYRALGELLITDPTGVIFVRESDYRIVGMLGAMLFDHPVTGERTAGELFWWAAPNSRGVTGVRLLKALEAWAREKGAERIQMTQPVWAERVGAIYSALGYEKQEIAWTRRVSHD